MLTNEALFFSNTSTILAKSVSERLTADRPCRRRSHRCDRSRHRAAAAAARGDPSCRRRIRRRRSGRRRGSSPRVSGLDVGERRFALSVERVELHVEAFVGRDAGVDGAANFADWASSFRRMVPKPEKRRPVPARTGNRPRDSRQRLVSPALILEAVVETVAQCSTPCHSRISRVPAIGRSPLRTGSLPLTRRSSSSISAVSFASARADSPP